MERKDTVESPIKKRVRQLVNVKPEKRMQTEQTLKNMNQDDIETLISALHHEKHIQRKRHLHLLIYWVCMVALFCVYEAWVKQLIEKNLSMTLFTLVMVTILGIIFWIKLLLDSILFAKQFRHLIFTLSRYDDPRICLPLMRTLNICPMSSRVHIINALTRLLPQLDQKHIELLDSRHEDCLLRELRNCTNVHFSSFNSDYAVSILRVLKFIGTQKTLTEIKRLMTNKAPTPKELKILEAATDCFPVLCDRINQLHSARTLVRACTNEENTDTLLRTVTMHNTTPNFLLRSSDSTTET